MPWTRDHVEFDRTIDFPTPEFIALMSIGCYCRDGSLREVSFSIRVSALGGVERETVGELGKVGCGVCVRSLVEGDARR